MVAQDIEKLKAEFGDRAFSGKDIARVLGIDPRGSGSIIRYMHNRGMTRLIKTGAYQFIVADAPVKTVSAPVVPALEIAPLCATPSVVRIGELYLHERVLLIADKARQEGSDALRVYTPIIEIDPASKHPRNKVLNIIKARDPREYAAAIVWLDSLAGDAPHADDTALELAAELERKLNIALEERDEYKHKLDAIRGAL